MTPDPRPPAVVPPEWLAAYADDELDPAARAAVEQWLAEHPQGWAEVEAQRSLGPGNVSLWEQVAPPEPPPAAWNAVRRGIDAALSRSTGHGPTGPRAPRGRQRVWRVCGGLALAAVTAALAGVVWDARLSVPPPSTDRPALEVSRPGPPDPPRARPPRPAVLDELGVLAVASDDEVTLQRVAAPRGGWLPVGRPLLPEVLVLATADEVHLEGLPPGPTRSDSGPRMLTGPGDAPMIYAAQIR